MSDPEGDAQVYAWNWFALHSNQRMQLVNFWLVAVAFLCAAFVQARAGNLRTIAIGICIAGVVASIAFAMLDARTRRLVQVAEEALRKLEDRRVAEGFDACTRLVYSAHAARRSKVSSYRLVIQGLQVIVAALFAIAGILTIVGG